MLAQVFPLPLAGPLEELQPEIDDIFFESAVRKTFATPEARAAFHDLWLGRYLRHCPGDCFLALDHDSHVVGYLAGSLVSNREPLPGPDNYGLFPQWLVAAYPAHIHTNVRKDWRGKGVGALLIAAFTHHCHVNKVKGFHAITAARSRPAKFFQSCGLQHAVEAVWNNHPIVFLGCQLD